MPDYKVYFKFNVAFPKGRIAGKNGNANITCPELDATKNNPDLIGFLAQEVNKEYKTGKVFSLDITDIKQV